MAFYAFGLGTTTGEECYDESGVYIGCPWDAPSPVLTYGPVPGPRPAPALPPPSAPVPAPPPPTSSPVPAAPSTPVTPTVVAPPTVPTAPVPSAPSPTPTPPDHIASTLPTPDIFAPSPAVNVEVSRVTGGDALSRPAEPGVGKVVLYGAVAVAAIWLLRR